MWSIYDAIVNTDKDKPLLKDSNHLEAFHNGFRAWTPISPLFNIFLKHIKIQQSINLTLMGEAERKKESKPIFAIF